MIDYVKKAAATTGFSAATTSTTAVQILATTVPLKSVRVDNQLDVDAAVIIGSAQLLYLRAGASNELDLSADNAAFASGVSVSVFFPGGSGPSTGYILLDSML